jgi:hypothetical protein
VIYTAKVSSHFASSSGRQDRRKARLTSNVTAAAARSIARRSLAHVPRSFSESVLDYWSNLMRVRTTVPVKVAWTLAASTTVVKAPVAVSPSLSTVTGEVTVVVPSPAG